MKKLFPLLLVLAACHKNKITVSMDAGCITAELAQGSFASSTTTETYWVCHTDPEGELGFIVIRVLRDTKSYNELPYKLMDSLEMGKKYISIDSATFNWAGMSKVELKDMAIIKDRYFTIMDEFTKHVKCVVDESALKTGIDYDTKLIYQ